jgi:hypothetical protein
VHSSSSSIIVEEYMRYLAALKKEGIVQLKEGNVVYIIL